MPPKMSDFRLIEWNGRPKAVKPEEIQPMLKVCRSGRHQMIGVVVEVGKLFTRTGTWEGKVKGMPRDVTIIWATGRKKGTKEVVRLDRLVALDKFRASLQEYVDNVNAVALEAEMLGFGK